MVRIYHAGAEVARHDQRSGQRERAVERAHLRGIVMGDDCGPPPGCMAPPIASGTELLRSLHEYEQVAGGG